MHYIGAKWHIQGGEKFAVVWQKSTNATHCMVQFSPLILKNILVLQSDGFKCKQLTCR